MLFSSFAILEPGRTCRYTIYDELRHSVMAFLTCGSEKLKAVMQSNCLEELPGISWITAVTLNNWLFDFRTLLIGLMFPKKDFAADAVNTMLLGSANAVAALP